MRHKGKGHVLKMSSKDWDISDEEVETSGFQAADIYIAAKSPEVIMEGHKQWHNNCVHAKTLEQMTTKTWWRHQSGARHIK